MQLSVAGQEISVESGASFADAFKQALSGKQFKNLVVARCGETLLDLGTTIPADCASVEPVFADSPEGLEVIRHSTAHLMAEAVKKLFPTAKVTIGPSVDNGFYYDFDYERPFTPEDLEAIETEMVKAVGADKPFARAELSSAEARAKFAAEGETYKVELIDDLGVEHVSTYTQGGFTDLCRGPHVPRTGLLKAFKLTSVAGAYWRGDEKNPQLQRIYGTAWANPKDLKVYLERIEEAKKRDHRKLGVALDLFSFHEEVGGGMVLWHPKGALTRAILEDFERKEHLKRGYQFVQGPLILRRELWEKSGHYENYRENMYFTEIDEQAYGIKPMNCLSLMLIFKSRLRSYRDLPQRYFEHGVVHRHEKSGVLHGLLRVRSFTQDDAHILCRPDQLREEIIGVVKFVRDVMDIFGFNFEAEISTRPEKSIGSDEDWDRATDALKDALEHMNMPYAINAGDGAFYGPKIDIKIKDSLGRLWQCSTIQFDFNLPEKFGMTYIAEDGKEHRPYMVHRTLLGSLERFFGVLIEHYAGNFPLWLAPVQLVVMNITDAQADYARQVADKLSASGFRVKLNLGGEKVGAKIRDAEMQKVPCMVIVGGKEAESGMVSLRRHGIGDAGQMTVEELAERLNKEVADKK